MLDTASLCAVAYNVTYRLGPTAPPDNSLAKGMAMRRFCDFLLLLLLASPAVAQQEYPRAELFGGYSYLHIDTQGVTGSTLDALCNNAFGAGTCPPGSFQVHTNFSGWNGAAQANLNRWAGLVADFSGHYGTPVTISAQAQTILTNNGITGIPPKATSYSYLFGPVVSSRRGRLTLFGHALFGANDLSATLKSASVKGFAIPGLTASDTAFAAAFGGGADSRIAKNLAFRVQADYLLTTHDFSGGVQGVATHQNNVRASVGIVYNFGTKSTNAEPRQSAPRAPTAGMKLPSLGITVALGANPGAEITDEAPNGVAALAGLHVGDVINAVDGKPVRTPMELAAELANHAAGDKIKLGFLVHGQWQTETVLLLGNH